MSNLTPEGLWALLADQGRGVLATIKRDGRPQLSNIGYAWDPDARVARIIAGDFRAKARNLQRDRRASLHVTDDAFGLWLVAEGDVELSAPCRSLDDEVGQELLNLPSYRRIPPEDLEAHLEAYPLIDRLIIRLKVDRLYGGEASKALGIAVTA